MWRHIGQTVEGSSHAAEGSPCQDYGLVRVVGERSATTLIACVADGAGTARHGADGSRIACETVMECAAALFASRGGLDGLLSEDALRWCDDARQKIRSAAEDRGGATRDFATTLCAAILTPRQAFFFQIGDGAIILNSSGTYGVVFWPQSGEYANSTNFLTSEEFREHLEFHAASGAFSDVALMTDGLARLALTFETRTAHPPFFAPLFGALRSAENTEPLERELRRFLQSDSVQARSDDDKTLILASRIAD